MDRIENLQIEQGHLRSRTIPKMTFHRVFYFLALVGSFIPCEGFTVDSKGVVEEIYIELFTLFNE